MKKTVVYMMSMLLAATLTVGCGGKGAEGAKTEGGEAPKTEATSSKSPKEMLAKTWHVDVDKVELPAEIAEKAKANPELMAKMKEGMKSVSFEFKADGTCSFASPDGKENRTGTWKISDDGKTLTVIDDKLKKEETTPIASLTDNELVMDMKGMKLHFKP